MPKQMKKNLIAFTLALATCAVQAAPTFWTDWQTGSNTAGFTGNGTITTGTATINVTYSNPQGISFYQTGAAGEIDYWRNSGNPARNNASSPYTSGTVDNIPTGTDIVELQFAGSQTLHFSQAIANPFFSYVSLNGNGYAFDQDFDILSFGDGVSHPCGYWGCGTSFKQIVDTGGGILEYRLLGTGEPHGTIRFTGAFQDVSWRSLSNENWNGFTVGVQGTAVEVFGTPEPGSIALFGLALTGLAVVRKRKSA